MWTRVGDSNPYVLVTLENDRSQDKLKGLLVRADSSEDIPHMVGACKTRGGKKQVSGECHN